jgi:hypothetical protein
MSATVVGASSADRVGDLLLLEVALLDQAGDVVGVRARGDGVALEDVDRRCGAALGRTMVRASTLTYRLLMCLLLVLSGARELGGGAGLLDHGHGDLPAEDPEAVVLVERDDLDLDVVAVGGAHPAGPPRRSEAIDPSIVESSTITLTPAGRLVDFRNVSPASWIMLPVTTMLPLPSRGAFCRIFAVATARAKYTGDSRIVSTLYPWFRVSGIAAASRMSRNGSAVAVVAQVAAAGLGLGHRGADRRQAERVEAEDDLVDELAHLPVDDVEPVACDQLLGIRVDRPHLSVRASAGVPGSSSVRGYSPSDLIFSAARLGKIPSETPNSTEPEPVASTRPVRILSPTSRCCARVRSVR